jgi:hypothetical protein
MKNLVQGVVAVGLLLVWAGLYAAPIAVANAPGITVTFYDEPCQIKTVTNLPLRATWTQGGKTIEGCFGGFTEANVAGLFFADGTVSVVPAVAIKPLVSM